MFDHSPLTMNYELRRTPADVANLECDNFAGALAITLAREKSNEGEKHRRLICGTADPNGFVAQIGKNPPQYCKLKWDTSRRLPVQTLQEERNGRFVKVCHRDILAHHPSREGRQDPMDAKHVHVDEGVSGYHVAPMDRTEWKRVMDKLSDGGVLYVRWLDRISRRYDELHRVMQQLMGMGVKVICTLNGMSFNGTATEPMLKATRDAVLAFMAAQGEADYIKRREMQRRGIDIKKANGGYPGRAKTLDPATVKAWRTKEGASIAATAEYFEISVATVKRYCAA